MIRPLLVVHGGAGSLPSDEDRRQYLEGVRGALAAGAAELPQGARVAVLAAVVYLESHTITNAGRGAALAADGSVALDAGFMDGTSRRYGAVTGVRRFENPVLLAAHVSADGDFGRFLGPPDVDGLPAAIGRECCDNAHLITERARRLHQERLQRRAVAQASWLDTVGAVALDAGGHVAAAVSTGGLSLKRPGRIGDSPIVGGGFWADDRVGACVTTGVGEVLMRAGTARRCMQLVAGGRSPRTAAREALAELLEHEGDTRCASGLILISADGRLALAHHSREMSAGWIDADGRTEVSHLWREA